MTVDAETELGHIEQSMAKGPIHGPKAVGGRVDTDMIFESPLFSALGRPEDGSRWWWIVEDLTAADEGCDAAVGAMIGLAIGDTVGAPLEFLSVDARLPDWPDGTYRDTARPCLRPGFPDGKVAYNRAVNKFEMRPGQWTDDTSMALCIADTILARGRYHGGEARLRFYHWWAHGLNNAFRHDTTRKKRTSVGLGGATSNSLLDAERYMDGGPDAVPEKFEYDTEDAGNGPLMRLAPVPIAYHISYVRACEYAALSSQATHPGTEATACCRFMAFFISVAILTRKGGRKPSTNVRAFLQCVMRDFLEERTNVGQVADRGSLLLEALLTRDPPSEKEAHWDWQQPVLPIAQAVNARKADGKYNGFPVSSAYFGSYCMDGLAMALWALFYGKHFEHTMRLAVNLLGDADSVGAITGQLAGAIYGFTDISSAQFGQVCIANLRNWDPSCEIGLRAAVLYHHGPKLEVTLRQSEGHKTVRVFDEPGTAGFSMIGEIPSDTVCRAFDMRQKFVEVEFEGLRGWVGFKNTDLCTPCGMFDVGPHAPGRAPSWAPREPPKLKDRILASPRVVQREAQARVNTQWATNMSPSPRSQSSPMQSPIQSPMPSPRGLPPTAEEPPQPATRAAPEGFRVA